MERLRAFSALMRFRHTGQIIGIVSILSIKSHGVSAQSIFAITASLFLSIALFYFDDAHDHKSDLKAHPERPIPLGILTSNQVYLIGTASLCLGISFAASLTPSQLVLFLSAAVMGLASIFLKLVSIIRAAFTASMIFLLFPFSTSISLKCILFGLIVAFPHVAGSIAKDFIHSRGDERIGLQPPKYWTRYMASLIFFMSGGLILIPPILNLVDWLYIPIIFPTLMSCLVLGINVLRRQYRKVYVYGGIGMISSLVAFAISI